MTKQEFLNLPTNKKTVSKLQAIASKGLKCENAESFESKNWVFFAEAAKAIKNYLYLPKSIKSITDEVTTESTYNSLLKIKSHGYRKELNMPF